MKRALHILALAAAVGAPAVAAAASPQNGKVVYDKWCGPCHAKTTMSGFGGSPGLLPGSASLRVKYRGQKSPLIEEWTDLTPDYIRYVVRNGIKGMPFTRKTEIGDAELDDLAAYLTRNTPVR